MHPPSKKMSDRRVSKVDNQCHPPFGDLPQNVWGSGEKDGPSKQTGSSCVGLLHSCNSCSVHMNSFQFGIFFFLLGNVHSAHQGLNACINTCMMFTNRNIRKERRHRTKKWSWTQWNHLGSCPWQRNPLSPFMNGCKALMEKGNPPKQRKCIVHALKKQWPPCVRGVWKIYLITTSGLRKGTISIKW